MPAVVYGYRLKGKFNIPAGTLTEENGKMQRENVKKGSDKVFHL